ncbi:MAG: MCE family protein [Rhodoferax sp.]|nr:MCE family protein [Rhodoferax sp.]
MENKAHAFAAGIFVVAVLALLVTLAFWLKRDSGDRLVYELSSSEGVTGLQPQANVRYKGVMVGRVTAIELDPVVTGHVLLHIAVDAGTPITKTTFASLAFQGVTGLAFIQLDDVPGAHEPLETSAQNPARIPIRPSLMSRLSDQGANLLAQVELTAKRLNALLTHDNQKKVLQSVEHIGQAGLAISQLSRQVEKVLGTQMSAVNLGALAHETQTTLKGLQATGDAVKQSAQAFKTLAERMNAPGGAMDAVTRSADAFVATGRTLNTSLVPRINRSTDDAARTLRQVGDFADVLGDNPQSLLFGRGAIAPGPGEAGFVAPAAP